MDNNQDKMCRLTVPKDTRNFEPRTPVRPANPDEDTSYNFARRGPRKRFYGYVGQVLQPVGTPQSPYIPGKRGPRTQMTEDSWEPQEIANIDPQYDPNYTDEQEAGPSCAPQNISARSNRSQQVAPAPSPGPINPNIIIQEELELSCPAPNISARRNRSPQVAPTPTPGPTDPNFIMQQELDLSCAPQKISARRRRIPDELRVTPENPKLGSLNWKRILDTYNRFRKLDECEDSNHMPEQEPELSCPHNSTAKSLRSTQGINDSHASPMDRNIDPQYEPNFTDEEEPDISIAPQAPPGRSFRSPQPASPGLNESHASPLDENIDPQYDPDITEEQELDISPIPHATPCRSYGSPHVGSPGLDDSYGSPLDANIAIEYESNYPEDQDPQCSYASQGRSPQPVQPLNYESEYDATFEDECPYGPKVKQNRIYDPKQVMPFNKNEQQEYNETGRSFHVSEFQDRERREKGYNPQELRRFKKRETRPYDESGRNLNVSEFLDRERRKDYQPHGYWNFMEHDVTFYNESGRPLNPPEFQEREAAELNQGDYAEEYCQCDFELSTPQKLTLETMGSPEYMPNASFRPQEMSYNELPAPNYFEPESPAQDLQQPHTSAYNPQNLSLFNESEVQDYGEPEFMDLEKSMSQCLQSTSRRAYNPQEIRKFKDDEIQPHKESEKPFNLSEFLAFEENEPKEDPCKRAKLSKVDDFAPTKRTCAKPSTTEADPEVSQTAMLFQSKASIPETKKNEPEPRTTKDTLFETLGMDTYYPGLIVDTVNKEADFNKISFDMVFGGKNVPLELEPEQVPMTLVEAFLMRIEYEHKVQTNSAKRKLFCDIQRNDEENPLEHFTLSPQFWAHRDELKLASTIDIDLMAKMADNPETELTEAIHCLLKAEKMDTFDKHVYMAEEAIMNTESSKQELAALKSTCSFKLEVRKDEQKVITSYEPLAIISYLGTTKPSHQCGGK